MVHVSVRTYVRTVPVDGTHVRTFLAHLPHALRLASVFVSRPVISADQPPPTTTTPCDQYKPTHTCGGVCVFFFFVFLLFAMYRYQPDEEINLTVDNFASAGGLLRGLFECVVVIATQSPMLGVRVRVRVRVRVCAFACDRVTHHVGRRFSTSPAKLPQPSSLLFGTAADCAFARSCRLSLSQTATMCMQSV
jgi:hypothetical protein